jgi:hypothetical protein
MTISIFKTKVLLTSVITMLVLSLTLIGATFVAAAPPAVAVDLDQCRNGALGDPQTQIQQCITTGSGASGWVNGNAGAANAHFAEGESISYRARLSGLKTDDVVVLIMGYDVIHNGHDAIDFLTDKNRWQTPETTVAAKPDIPCSGISPAPAECSPLATGGTPYAISIGAPPTHIKVDPSKTLTTGCQDGTNSSDPIQQPTVAYNAVNSAGEENMELFGGTDGSFAYFGPAPVLTDKNGDQEQQVEVTFKATAANPILAWGGHIGSRLDWGCDGSIRSASGISGSPYHMRIKSASVNGIALSLGNQDRSLAASAVVFIPSSLTTTPRGSANYDATVTDSLNVGVSNAGGTADFYLFTDLTECHKGAAGSFVGIPNTGVAVTNGTTTTVSQTVNDLTLDTTFYWYVSYSGDNTVSPAVGSGISDCTETVSFTAPVVSHNPQ